MRDLASFLFIIMVLFCVSPISSGAQEIIPKPETYKSNGEIFQLDPDVEIIYSEGLKDELLEEIEGTGGSFGIFIISGHRLGF